MNSSNSSGRGIKRLKEELRELRHFEYVELREAETGEVIVKNTAPKSSHFNNAEFSAFYAAGFLPIHVECDSEEVWLRER